MTSGRNGKERPYQRFRDIGYEDFRALARAPGLSDHERIGFPDEYRAGKEQAIWDDLVAKLPALVRRGAIVVDIGCGCGVLARYTIEQIGRAGGEIWTVDSPEMLARLPDAPHVRKLPGRFPEDADALAQLRARVDAVICYSVLQYVFKEGNCCDFVDACMELLAPGGAMVIGDIPNASMRNRFLSSGAGRAYHAEHYGGDSEPEVRAPGVWRGEIDDAVVLGLLARARGAGFHAFVVPQSAALPMANRREDVVIVRP